MAIQWIGRFFSGDSCRRCFLAADVQKAGSEFENHWAKRKLRPTYFAFAQPYDVCLWLLRRLEDTWYAKKDEEVEHGTTSKKKGKDANDFIRFGERIYSDQINWSVASCCNLELSSIWIRKIKISVINGKETFQLHLTLNPTKIK